MHTLLTYADINECASGSNPCHENAACNNTAGGYSCTCNRGFQGDGWKNCTGKVETVAFCLHIQYLLAFLSSVLPAYWNQILGYVEWRLVLNPAQFQSGAVVQAKCFF